MINNSRDFLDSVSGYVNSPYQGPLPSVERPTRLGTIDPYYTSGPARVLLDGENTKSYRGYSWLDSYTPVSGDRVFLIPVGQTYIIGGKVTSNVSAPRWLVNAHFSGWVDYDNINYHGSVMTKTPTHVTKFSGLIRSGDASNFKTIQAMPEEFRPQIDMVFPSMANGAAGSVLVTPDGYMMVHQWGSSTWMSLANVTYPTEPLTWNDVVLENSFVASTSPYSLGLPQWAKDTAGRIWFRGAVSRAGANPTSDTTIFTLPASARITRTQHINTMTIDGSSNFGFIDVTSAGAVRWKVGSVNTHMSLSGAVYPDSTASWTAGTFQGGWLNYDVNTFTSAGYRKDTDGIVHLRGLVKSGTIGSTIFNLPAGFRPSKIVLRQTVSNQAIARVDIHPSGNVIPVTGTNGWFSLDGVSFVAEV